MPTGLHEIIDLLRTYRWLGQASEWTLVCIVSEVDHVEVKLVVTPHVKGATLAAIKQFPEGYAKRPNITS